MPDFILTPDEPDFDRPERSRPVREVSTGLADTAAVPKRRAGKDTPPCYAPCVLCGRQVLSGQTTSGQTLHLDTSSHCFCVVWENKSFMPTLVASRGYVIHTCQDGKASEKLQEVQQQLALAYRSYNKAQEDLATARQELRQSQREESYWRLQCLDVMNQNLRLQLKTTRSPDVQQELTRLIALCHPDKWAAGQPATELAHEITVALNALRAQRKV